MKDSYSNKTQNRINLLLVATILILMLFAFRATAKHRESSVESAIATQKQ